MSHATHPELPGTGQSGIIAGYRLDRCVGQGRTAVVYLAQDERLGRLVALKVLAPELARDAAFRTRMIRESRAAAALDHPHIIPVFDADEAGGTLYIAMRYVRGGDARSLLNQLGPLPLGHAWQIIAQIASALDALHAHGLIHCDVRPANILLDAAEGQKEVRPTGAASMSPASYLSDFGMSKAFSPGQIIATGQFTGTLDYTAPEQIEGRTLDGRADLYSLACTAFELLCGTPPFGQDQGLTLMYAQLYAPPPTASARRAELPAAVDPVLATALAKNPADRYPSCGRFAEELRVALGLGPAEPADPPRARSPRGSGPASTSGLAPAIRQPATAADQPATMVKQLVTAEEQQPGAEAQPAALREQPAGLGPLDYATAKEPSGRKSEPSAQRLRLCGPVLAVAAAGIIIAAIVAGVALSGRSAPARPAASTTLPAASSPSPSAASPLASVLAAQQAAALGTLLTSSVAARTALHQAVDQVGACANLPGAVNQLQTVVNQRASEYGRASALQTSALPGGTKVKSELIAALSSSLTADRDYLTWAQQQQAGGCTPSSQSSAYNAAFSASQVADAAKMTFVQVWNPVAARYGIAQNSPRDI